MLKVYNVYSYVSIDGEEWREVGTIGHVMKDEAPDDKIFLLDATFEECCDYLTQNGNLDGLYLTHTLWKNKPIIETHTLWSGPQSYKNFTSISYKYIYKENTYMTLRDVFYTFPAEKCVQYLKDRGVTSCQMLTK